MKGTKERRSTGVPGHCLRPFHPQKGPQARYLCPGLLPGGSVGLGGRKAESTHLHINVDWPSGGGNSRAAGEGAGGVDVDTDADLNH